MTSPLTGLPTGLDAFRQAIEAKVDRVEHDPLVAQVTILGTAVATKADSATVTTALAAKADSTTVTAGLATKADGTATTTALNARALKTELAAQRTEIDAAINVRDGTISG